MAFTNLFISVAVMSGAFLSTDLSKKTSLHLLLVHLCSFSATSYTQENGAERSSLFLTYIITDLILSKRHF